MTDKYKEKSVIKNITVIILTFNEEIHIKRCIESLQDFAHEIFIIDSYSNDNTVKIAESLGAKVFYNKWINYANQFQWGLDNCPIETDWVMRMDADEYVLPELSTEINNKLYSISSNFSGIFLKRRVLFMERWIKHGSYYPIWLLRIWRTDQGFIEERWMDEHIKLIKGEKLFFDNDIVDHNKNSITWWIQKHNNYATREAFDILNTIHNFKVYDDINPNFFGSQEERKRYLKHLYCKLPLFLRPFLYFTWRYFIKLGFLDGKQGLIWHFLQGFWYRFLVDVKIFEIYRNAGTSKDDIRTYLTNYYGVNFD